MLTASLNELFSSEDDSSYSTSNKETTQIDAENVEILKSDHCLFDVTASTLELADSIINGVLEHVERTPNQIKLEKAKMVALEALDKTKTFAIKAGTKSKEATIKGCQISKEATIKGCQISKEATIKGYQTSKEATIKGYQTSKQATLKGYETTKNFSISAGRKTKVAAVAGFNKSKQFTSKAGQNTKTFYNEKFVPGIKKFGKNKTVQTSLALDCPLPTSETELRQLETVEDITEPTTPLPASFIKDENNTIDHLNLNVDDDAEATSTLVSIPSLVEKKSSRKSISSVIKKLNCWKRNNVVEDVGYNRNIHV